MRDTHTPINLAQRQVVTRMILEEFGVPGTARARGESTDDVAGEAGGGQGKDFIPGTPKRLQTDRIRLAFKKSEIGGDKDEPGLVPANTQFSKTKINMQ